MNKHIHFQQDICCYKNPIYIVLYREQKLNSVCTYFVNNERRGIIYDNNQINIKIIFELEKYIFSISDFITIAH